MFLPQFLEGYAAFKYLSRYIPGATEDLQKKYKKRKKNKKI